MSVCRERKDSGEQQVLEAAMSHGVQGGRERDSLCLCNGGVLPDVVREGEVDGRAGEDARSGTEDKSGHFVDARGSGVETECRGVVDVV